MWVKICGIHRSDAARAIARMNPSAIGLNRYEPSPRYLTRKRASEIARIIRRSSGESRVAAVYVDEIFDVIEGDISEFEPDIVQLHGNEDPEFVQRLEQFPVDVIKAFRVGEDFDPETLDYYDCWGHLVDAYHPDKPGGTGRRAPWSRVREFSSVDRLIIAGGIDQDNVLEALDVVQPWGVDICSGVETAGKKDPELVRGLLKKIDDHE